MLNIYDILPLYLFMTKYKTKKSAGIFRYIKEKLYFCGSNFNQ